jgi:hypothetical protein
MKFAAGEEIAIKDRTERKSFLDLFLQDVYLVAEAAFFIGCGAVKVAWEGLEKLLKAARDRTGTDRSIREVPERERPNAVKIPLLPIDNYTRLDADRIVRLLRGLSADQLRLLQEFETRQKNRQRVLRAIDRLLEQRE